MNHSFNIEIAKQFGVNSAIILNNIFFWILKNKANNVHYYDENYWTRNTEEAFVELFPYLTKNQIRYALKKLINDGVVLVGNYNQKQYDRTLWYAINPSVFNILENSQMHFENFTNANRNIPTPIPYINKNINKKKKDISKDISKKEKYFDNEKVNEIFVEFLEMRKKLKAVNSDRAIKLLINKLKPYPDDTKIAMIEKSIESSWKGIYEIKQPFTNKKISDKPGWLDKNVELENDPQTQKELEELLAEYK